MEESIQEIANETEIETPVQNSDGNKDEKRSKFVTKLLELDIATHILVFLGIVIIIGAYIILPSIASFLQNQKNTNNQTGNSVQLSDAEVDKSIRELSDEVVRPVYASDAVVDPKQIFSYPASKVTLAFTGEPKKEVYGFFPYWMLPAYDEISLNALTTIGLFALDVDRKGNMIATGPDGKTSPGWDMWSNPSLNLFINKAKKRRIKVELGIKSFSNANTEALVLSDDAQKTFIANVLFMVNSKGLDGVNLDFEYVGTPTKEVRDGFTRMIQNLRLEMKRQYPNLSLTLDTYVSEAAIPRLIDLEALESTVDAFIIMDYDFHTPRGGPGPIAPMEGGGYSTIGFLQSYFEKVSPEKLVLAVAYYGYDWTNPPSSSAKVLPYAELAAMSKNHTIQWDDAAQSPFYTYTDPTSGQKRIVYFENPRSLGVKYDYVNRKNMRGIGIWALGYDGLNSDLRTLIAEKFSRILTTN